MDAFSALRGTIPLPEREKATKLQTLQAATSYIEFLHEIHEVAAYKSSHGKLVSLLLSGKYIFVPSHSKDRIFHL